MKIARASGQGLLLDVPPRFALTSNAQARNAYGSAAQEIVCAALDLHPIAIDGTCEACFDAERAGCFWEIKSVHRSSKVVVYDWRMTKEAAAGVPLRYAILCHNCRGCRDGAGLFAAMASGGLEILSVPACEVHVRARLEPLNVIRKAATDPRNGYTRKGYKDGYRNLPAAKLRKAASQSRSVEFDLHGVSFSIPILSL